MGMIFRRGNKIRGSKAATEMDTASVIHHTTIQTATAITASPFSETRVFGRFRRIKKKMGPNNNPNFLLKSIWEVYGVLN